MFCLDPCSNAYHDDVRATCNSLLRIKTPYPQRSVNEEMASRIVGCVCSPLKCLEGLGMIACGALLWPIPCTVCRISTEHAGTSVSLNKCCLDFRCINVPCYYQDRFSKPTPDGFIQEEAQGYDCSCAGCDPHYQGDLPQIFASSTTTGFCCMAAGVGKIVTTVCQMACCPFQCCCCLCCGK